MSDEVAAPKVTVVFTAGSASLSDSDDLVLDLVYGHRPRSGVRRPGQFWAPASGLMLCMREADWADDADPGRHHSVAARWRAATGVMVSTCAALAAFFDAIHNIKELFEP